MVTMKKIMNLFTLLLFTTSICKAQWAEVGGASANPLNANGPIYCVKADAVGNIYACGYFTDASSHHIVAKWDGTSWTSLWTNNLNSGIISADFRIAIDAAGNVYTTVVGSTTNSVAKWDGTNWTELGTGNSGFANSTIIALTSDAAGNIYAGGSFTSSSNGKKYVAKWNGTNWSDLGSSSTYLNANNSAGVAGILDLVTDNFNNVFALVDTTGSGARYVAKWDGSSWSHLGTVANAFLPGDFITCIQVDNTGNVYAAGYLNSGGYNYLAKWNGVNWEPVGIPGQFVFNDVISSITSDNAGNVYVGGHFTNSNGKEFVAKWNGTLWSELALPADTLNANMYINSITSDLAGNIYAGGEFTNTSGYSYVAKFGDNVTHVASANVRMNRMYPNPTSNILNLEFSGDVQNSEIKLFNILGEKVLHKSILGNKNSNLQIDLSSVSSGTYFIQIKTRNEIFIEKIFVE